MNTKYISKFFLNTLISGAFLLLLLGISTTRTNAQTLIVLSGNPSCADLNADNATFPTITSDYGFKLQNAPSGTFRFTNGDGELTGGAIADLNKKLTTIVNNGKVLTNFSVTNVVIKAVMIKAGEDTNVYVYNPGIASGGYLYSPENKDISHMELCYGLSLAPTAATAMIAGRVQVESSKLRASTLVTILNTSTLETRTVYTNRLGYYEFSDLTVGDTYIVTARSKGFEFAPQTFTLVEDNALDMQGYPTSRYAR